MARITNNPDDKASKLNVRMSTELYEKVSYWSKKRGMSLNQYVIHALEKAIAFECQDYPLPTMEQARLNQLVDVVALLSSNVKNLESVVVSGFDSLVGLTRGDNYLLDEGLGDK